MRVVSLHQLAEFLAAVRPDPSVETALARARASNGEVERASWVVCPTDRLRRLRGSDLWPAGRPIWAARRLDDAGLVALRAAVARVARCFCTSHRGPAHGGPGGCGIGWRQGLRPVAGAGAGEDHPTAREARYKGYMDGLGLRPMRSGRWPAAAWRNIGLMARDLHDQTRRPGSPRSDAAGCPRIRIPTGRCDRWLGNSCCCRNGGAPIIGTWSGPRSIRFSRRCRSVGLAEWRWFRGVDDQARSHRVAALRSTLLTAG